MTVAELQGILTERTDLTKEDMRLIFGGLAIGLLFWWLLLLWMSCLNRRHGHTDATIQMALTVFGAYTCFYVAEGVLEVRRRALAAPRVPPRTRARRLELAQAPVAPSTRPTSLAMRMSLALAVLTICDERGMSSVP